MKDRFFLVLISLLLMSFAPVAAQPSACEPEVMETVELMSVLARAAGAREYNMDMAGQYTQDTEAWFAPYKNHPMVSYYQGLMQQYNIGFNAPMDLAVNLVIDGGRIKFAGDKSCMDPRWTHVNLVEFVSKLNQYYTDTRFHEFFQQHEAFYNEGLQLYKDNVMPHFHQDWYPRFYGTAADQQYRIIIGFTNGGSNYGANRQLPGKSKEMFSVVGYYVAPGVDKPFADGVGTAMVLIHEFNHSFVNHLYDDHTALLDPVANKLFALSESMMRNQAYPEPRTVMNETLVRAAVIQYMQDYGYTPQDIDEEMSMNVSKGFTWMPEAAAALRGYAGNRGKYPTFSSYYPQIAKALNKYADDENKRVAKVLNAKVKPQPRGEAKPCMAEVMESVELMGVLSRLAGYEEYNYGDVPDGYAWDIEQWFEPHMQHPIIAYYQGLRQQCGIAYDAPMSLAVRLAVEGGKIVRIKEQFAPGQDALDSRWSYVNMDEFLGLLNQFYTDSRFHEFYEQHQPYYQERLANFNDNVMSGVQKGWFSNFLGMPSSNVLRVILGFANGAGNGYGAASHPQGRAGETFLVMGGSDADFSNPQYEQSVASLARMITGMLSNTMVDPIVEDVKKSPEINDVGNKLYQSNMQLMNNAGIDNGAGAIGESLASASSIINMLQNGYDADQLKFQLSRASTRYPWMPELVTAMANYANNRSKYQSITDFYPQLAKSLNKYLQREQQRYDKALK